MIEFGPFRYDAESRILHRGEEEIILPPRLLAVLESLLKRPGKIVPRNEVLASAWDGAFVAENSLTRAVSELRHTLGDDPHQPTYIQTIPRRGYRFIAPVTEPLRNSPPIQRPRGDGDRHMGERSFDENRLCEGGKLGSYELTGRVGAGAMGEIWRARDTELEREVAIKMVPVELAGNAAVAQRLRREALMLAALNHPNIATIHGVEESDGQRFIIMELLEGETLQERLERGPFAFEIALDVARQVAEALGAAHARGIIHRDLKPANVVLSADGRAKVLDFGLAKDLEAETSPSESSDRTRFTPHAPAIGTAPYMSPEQARGEPVDRRTDIWAFGCLVYELLTGRRAFECDSVVATLSAILDREPDWTLLPPGTPRPVRRLLRRCLTKDPGHRIHDIADARIEIEEAQGGHTDAEPAIRVPPVRPRAGLLPWGIAILAIVAAVAMAIRTGPSDDLLIRRFEVPLPADQALSTVNAPTLALSPDGTALVFAAFGPDGISRLYRRPLDGFYLEEIPGSEGATGPFFSHDGQWIGFVGPGHTIYKSPMGDALPVKICNAPGAVWGAQWAADDTIFFGAPQGLMRVAADGGSPPTLLDSPSQDHEVRSGAWPQLLPDGKHLLFGIEGADDWETVVLDLETGDRRTVMRNAGTGQVLYVDGHLVYPWSGQLLARPFDPASGMVSGAARPVVSDVYTTRLGSGGAAYFSFSDSGVLAYVAGSAHGSRSRLVWVDPDGSEEPLEEIDGDLHAPQISPDGERIAVARRMEDGSSDIWIWDNDRPASALRTNVGASLFPVWSPDGTRITFRGSSPAPGALYTKRADGSSEAELFVHTGEMVFPGSWSPDGRIHVFFQSSLQGGFGLWTIGVDGDPQPSVLIDTPHIEGASHFSPDGKLLAYISSDDDRFNIYVEPYPPTGPRWPISSDGGGEPVWSTDGRTLYYRRGYQMMAVDIDTEPTFRASPPRLVFSKPFDLNAGALQNYDVSAAGRFLMIRSRRPHKQLKVILDGFSVLREGVPTER